MGALDAWNAMSDQISRISKVTLKLITRTPNLQKEIIMKLYTIHPLFGMHFPLVKAYGVEVVDHIDNHFSQFKGNMMTAQQCTAFLFDLARIEAAYYNTCIKAL